jgi:CheY-like chemotaxis protein
VPGIVDRVVTPAPGAPRPVLVVEDDDATRAMLVAAIGEEGGYPVVAVRDGADALAQARRVRPAVVVLDVRLPDMDGGEVARRLKVADPTGCWIVGVSAYGPPGDAAPLFDGFLWKPIYVDDLLMAIEEGMLRAGPAAEST